VRPLYFLHGPEEFMKREFLRELMAAVLPEGDRTFNLDILYGDEFDPQAFDDRVQAFPLFAARRLVVLRNFDAISPSQRERVVERIASLPEGLVLVIESGRKSSRPSPTNDKSWRAHGCRRCSRRSMNRDAERVLGRVRREAMRRPRRADLWSNRWEPR
jgi:DNA polymerase III delta subunit